MEGDRLHPPANVEKMRQGIPLTDADRGPWLDRIGEELKSWAAEGRSGVLTCSALKRAYRDRIRSARPDVRFIYMKGSEALIAARVAARHHEYMPASLLRSQFDTLEEPTPDEPGVVTVDAGGTPDEEVAAVIAALNLSPFPVSSRVARRRAQFACGSLDRISPADVPRATPSTVMAGLDPAIHASPSARSRASALPTRLSAPFARTSSDSPSKRSGVDGRVKPGHDGSFP